MKKSIITLVLMGLFSLCITVGYTQNIPKNSGNFVNDYGNILTTEEEKSLKDYLSTFRDKTTSEVVIVTIPSLESYPIENYAVRLFEQWGIGDDKKDNGVLILTAVKEKEVRIEVGYGAEGILPDGLAGEIIRQYIIPSFKEGKYGEGLMEGTQAVTRLIAKEYKIAMDSNLLRNDVSTNKKVKHKQRNIWLLIVLVFIVITCISTENGRMFLLFLLQIISSSSNSSSGSGGFGGGSSGGGGASGKW